MRNEPKSEWEPLFAANRPLDAIALLEKCAKAGDARALYRLSGLLLIGNLIPRDHVRARELLRRAVQIGHVDAALLEIALTANGTGGSADWQKALGLLRKAALSDPVALHHLALIEAMQIDANGFPLSLGKPTVLSENPHVVRFEQFLTREECALLAQTVQDILEPATVFDPASGKLIAHPIRSSDTAVIGPARENMVARAINLRIAMASDTQVAQGEALTVLRYRPGQQYRLHLDAIGSTKNQRDCTMLIYLNDGFAGGETVFPSVGLICAPSAGDAILFQNVLPDGSVNPLSQHAGLPVSQGVKWLATRWIRRRKFHAWSSPEESIAS